MKNSILITAFLFLYFQTYSCSFAPIPFCNTVNDENIENVILRGYFVDDISNGMVFQRLETLRGEEDRKPPHGMEQFRV